LPITTDGRGGVDAAHGGVAGGVKSAHRALGTDTITLAEAWITNPATLNGNKGPCVTCHVNANMTGMPTITTTATAPFLPYSTVAGRTSRFLPALRTGAGHSFSAVSNEASAQTCMPCHNDAQEFDAVLNVGNFALAAEEKLAEAKPYYLAGLAAIKKWLRDYYAIDYNPGSNPYFFEKDTTTAVTDWTRNGKITNPNVSVTVLDTMQAARLMGACFNLNLLTRDPGAYVHGRSYTQRLIFDTIDWLNDRVINQNAAQSVVDSGLYPTLFPDLNDHWLWKAAGARK
jgi:hypothetical protein